MKGINSISVFVKANLSDLELLKRHAGAYRFEIREAYWLKLKDKNNSYYEIKFANIPLNKLISLCDTLKERADIEQIEILFKSYKDCLLRLQDKGFLKYEEIDYVDFRYEKKNVIIAVIKEDDLHKLKLQVIDENKEIDTLYFQRLIKRVFEIIG